MSELKIGGYKQNPLDFDLDLSQPPTEPSTEPTQEPVEPTTPEPVEPVIEPSTEPTQEPVEPTTPEPVEPTQQNDSDLPQNSSSFNNPTVQDKGLDITDELILNHLSEKLGKEVKDFSELVNQSNPLDKDPYLKQLYEWREKTGRPIEDFVKYQKDYNSLSDIDVVRELLQHKYPSLENEELDIEMLKFLPDEMDSERELAAKKLELKKAAYEGREVLNKLKVNLLEPSEANFSPEIKQDLELAKQVKSQIAIEQKVRDEYSNNIKQVSGTLDNFKVPLSDKLTIDFKIPEQSKKEIPTLIDTMPHWRNQDGTWNHKAVVEDAVKIKHFNDIIKIVYEQGINAGKEEVIKTTNNTNFNEPTPAQANIQNGKGIVIEGLDKFMGTQGMKIGLKR